MLGNLILTAGQHSSRIGRCKINVRPAAVTATAHPVCNSNSCSCSLEQAHCQLMPWQPAGRVLSIHRREGKLVFAHLQDQGAGRLQKRSADACRTFFVESMCTITESDAEMQAVLRGQQCCPCTAT
eukprot:GHUV01042674.1.p1 GENE.GHUV01042674.1~~GHUV01042674.1.p1  ORF type:complete len:126 (+),score=23.14 GHUV01042674.1:115-492(+)